jgi:hypothetical protein
MLTWNRTFLVGALASTLAACVAEDNEEVKGGDKPGKYDAIDSANDPARFDPNLERRFDRLPMEGQATNVPWASDYWASARDSINVRWHGTDPSPAEKYAQAFNRPSVPEEVSRYVGKMSSTETIPGWVGICEGWAASAIRERPAQRAVTRNGVTFLPGDLEGLVSLLYARGNSPSRFLSRRCNDENARFDDSGRAVSAECRDTNPGTLHIIVTNFLGTRGEAFVEDRTYDAEVWNQPLKGYKLTTMREISLPEAVALLGGASATGGETATVVQDRTLAAMEREAGMVTMPAGGVIHFNLSGSGDADLYVREGAEPTETEFTCRPYESSSTESCTIRAAGGTAIYWMISGYAGSSSVTLKTTVPAADAVYAFNPAAKRFAEVEMTLEYVTESSPGVQRTTPGSSSFSDDGYHYVLELDGDGVIIGGEYLQESQQLHPDFLWLPTGEPFSSVASIRYSDVKSLLDEAR